MDESASLWAAQECGGPLDTEGVLWVAALDRVPIAERVEWVKEMLVRVEQINAMRAGS